MKDGATPKGKGVRFEELPVDVQDFLKRYHPGERVHFRRLNRFEPGGHDRWDAEGRLGIWLRLLRDPAFSGTDRSEVVAALARQEHLSERQVLRHLDLSARSRAVKSVAKVVERDVGDNLLYGIFGTVSKELGKWGLALTPEAMECDRFYAAILLLHRSAIAEEARSVVYMLHDAVLGNPPALDRPLDLTHATILEWISVEMSMKVFLMDRPEAGFTSVPGRRRAEPRKEFREGLRKRNDRMLRLRESDPQEWTHKALRQEFDLLSIDSVRRILRETRRHRTSAGVETASPDAAAHSPSSLDNDRMFHSQHEPDDGQTNRARRSEPSPKPKGKIPPPKA